EPSALEPLDTDEESALAATPVDAQGNAALEALTALEVVAPAADEVLVEPTATLPEPSSPEPVLPELVASDADQPAVAVEVLEEVDDATSAALVDLVAAIDREVVPDAVPAEPAGEAWSDGGAAAAADQFIVFSLAGTNFAVRIDNFLEM